MLVSATARSQQQNGVQGNHGQGREGHLVEGADTAVSPDMNCAWDANGRQRNHEHAEPGVMVTCCSEPHVHQTGDSRQGCADPGVQDGSG